MSDTASPTGADEVVAAPDATTAAPEAAVEAPAPAPAEVTTTDAPAEATADATAPVTEDTTALDVKVAPAPTEVVAEDTTVAEPAPTDAVDDTEDVAALAAQIAADPEKAAAEWKRLRQENAQRRQENTDLKASTALSDDPEFNDGWRQLGEAFLSDPESVKDIFQELAGVEAPAAEVPKSPAEIEADITAKIADVFNRKQAETAAAAEAAVLYTKVAELGYNLEATPQTDPNAYAETKLFWDFVAAQPVGQQDAAAADDSVKKFKEAVVTQALADIKAAATAAPPAVAGTASASVTEPDSGEKKSAVDQHVEMMASLQARPNA